MDTKINCKKPIILNFHLNKPYPFSTNKTLKKKLHSVAVQYYKKLSRIIRRILRELWEKFQSKLNPGGKTFHEKQEVEGYGRA